MEKPLLPGPEAPNLGTAGPYRGETAKVVEKPHVGFLRGPAATAAGDRSKAVSGARVPAAVGAASSRRQRDEEFEQRLAEAHACLSSLLRGFGTGHR